MRVELSKLLNFECKTVLLKTRRYFCYCVPSRCSSRSYLSPTRWSPRRWQRLLGSKVCPTWPKTSNPREDFLRELCKNHPEDTFAPFVKDGTYYIYYIFTHLSTFPSLCSVASFIFWSVKFKDAVNCATKNEYHTYYSLLLMRRLIKEINVISSAF